VIWSFSFASLNIGHVFSLFTKQLTLDILCSNGWKVQLFIMVSLLSGGFEHCDLKLFSLRCI
jgi:hypothetical protein